MKLRINYQKVISQAHSIADNADQLKRQISLLEQMEQDCRIAWKGEAADAFVTKLRELRGEMRNTQVQMANLASTIKSCADRIDRQDRELEDRATILSVGH